MAPDFRPFKHRRVRLCAVAAGVTLALGGCAVPSLPSLDIPGNDPDFRTRVYLGAAIGNSHLTPDTRGTVFNVDSTDDLGTQLRLGVDVHNMLALEADTSVLGTAGLREAGTDVNYSAASLSALVYAMNGVQLRSRREGWSAYGRLGIGVLKKSSAVVALEEGGTGPILGIGAEYGMPNGLGIRGEITRFDDDAVYAGLGAVYRFGLTPRQVGTLIAEVSEPVLGAATTHVGEDGRTLTRSDRFRDYDSAARSQRAPSTKTWTGETFSRWQPPVMKNDRDRDGVQDAADLCPDSGVDVTIDQVGCGLFDTVLADVIFKSGSNWLTSRARGELDDFAVRLLAFPEARVRVIAHTDSTGPADANLDLSARRAEAVVQYLQTRGVSELQLEARGLGETRPLASNRDVKGRRSNRRVEIETLSSLSAEQLAMGIDAGEDSAEPARWLPPVTATVSPAKDNKLTTGQQTGAKATAVQPAIGAAKPGTAPLSGEAMKAASELVAEQVSGTRPAPLPRPAVVPGLEVAGIIRGVQFDSGSTKLRPEADTEISRIAGELGKFPRTKVAIIAHTDDRGTAEENLELSEGRARSVMERFVKFGVPRPRMTAEGYGESLPLVQNVTAEDRARNRRVELRLIR